MKKSDILSRRTLFSVLICVMTWMIPCGSNAWTRTEMQSSINVRQYTKELEKAEKEYREMERIYLSTPDIRERQRIAEKMSRLYMVEIKFRQIMIKYAGFDPDTATVSEVAGMASQLYNIEAAEEALKLFLEAGKRNDTVSLNMAGVIYYDHDMIPKALECFMSAADAMHGQGEPYLPVYYNLSKSLSKASWLTDDAEAKKSFADNAVRCAESYRKLLRFECDMDNAGAVPQYPVPAYAGLKGMTDIIRRNDCMRGKGLPEK